jgi:hypothetical protein
LDLRYVENPFDMLQLVNDPKSGVSAAFLFAGQTNSAESPDLLSLGRINYAPFWIFYRGAERLDRLTQLRGKRVNVPVFGALAHKIFQTHGVTAENTTISSLVGVPAAIKALLSGEVDVIFLPPIDLNSPAIQFLLRDPTVRLMNVVQADALTRLFPYFHRLVLPEGAVDLEKNIPAGDANLLASTNVVVVRKDLHPELINLMAQALKEEHGGAGIFQRAGEFPTQTDPELPMAEEAVDYYRNGPSFLQRYLPFWMINYAKRVAAILVGAIAVVIPLFTVTPRLYAWLVRLEFVRLYRRLRVVNARLKQGPTAADAAALQNDLETIDRAASIMPMRHSDMFFALELHIDQTRARLERRLSELRS